MLLSGRITTTHQYQDINTLISVSLRANRTSIQEFISVITFILILLIVANTEKKYLAIIQPTNPEKIFQLFISLFSSIIQIGSPL